jgi:ornithine carbamoyltransferase
MRDVASLLSLEESSQGEVRSLLGLAGQYESQEVDRPPDRMFVGFLSDRSSVRTRLAIHKASALLGKSALDFDFASSFYADPARRGDHASFVQAELASMRELGCSALVIRTHAHSTLTTWRELTSVPLINGCSDEEHPLQALSDGLVLSRHFGGLEGLRLTLVGNGASPVFRSLLFLSAMQQIDVVLACPQGYGFPPSLVERAGLEYDAVHTNDIAQALARAEAVYSDSVVYRALTEAEEKAFAPYRLTTDLVVRYAADARIMHCLPHADEIDAELLFGARSLAMRQVAARVPVTAAVIDWLSGLRSQESGRT